MKYPCRSLFCALALFVTACDSEDTTGESDAGTDGGASTDDAGPVDSGTALTTSVRFVVPTGDVLTSSTPIAVRAVVDGPADSVDIVIDGTLAANLTPPYEWTIPVSELAEGVHQVAPRARRGDATALGTAFVLTVDRTAPSLLTVTPANQPDTVRDPVSEPIVLTFDEPLAASTEITFTVSGRRGYPGTVESAATLDGITATYQQEIPWAEGIQVRFRASGTVTDAAGNSRALTVPQHAFKTWSYWGGSSEVTVGASGFTRFIAMNASGDYVGAWTEWSEYHLPSVRLVGFVRGDVLPYQVNPTLPDAGGELLDLALDEERLAVVIRLKPDDDHTFARDAVYTFDLDTRTWSSQVVVPEVPNQLSTTEIYGSTNGHQFLRISTAVNGQPNPWQSVDFAYRAPGASDFTPLSGDFEGFAHDVHHWPTTSGRLCALIDLDTSWTSREYVIRCLSGATGMQVGPDLAVYESDVEGVPGLGLRTNDRGDAIFDLRTTVRRYDPDTHALTDVTFPFAANEAALGRSGDLCAYVVETYENQFSRYRFAKLAHGSTTVTVPEPIAPLMRDYPTLAVDGAGHCFLGTYGDDYSSSAKIVHDATADGRFASPYAIGTKYTPDLYAAGDGQVLYGVVGTSTITLFPFVGH